MFETEHHNEQYIYYVNIGLVCMCVRSAFRIYPLLTPSQYGPAAAPDNHRRWRGVR